MNNNKRGQAALEYLATYGWVVIVLLATVGAVYYFGILDFNKFTPDRCTLIQGIDCVSYRVNKTGVDFVVRNGLGYDLTQFNITIDSNGGVCNNGFREASSGLYDGEEERLVINCGGVANAGDDLALRLKISYTTSSGSPHISYGNLETEVEE